MTLSTWTLAFLVAAAFVLQVSGTPAAAAVAAAKQAVTQVLDPALPRVAFEEWLREVAGSSAPATWDVNDCGEQTGNPKQDQGRDFPMCVEAAVGLAGQRELHVSLVVGTFKKGVVGVPGFWLAWIRKPDGSVEWIKRLSEVPWR